MLAEFKKGRESELLMPVEAVPHVVSHDGEEHVMEDTKLILRGGAPLCVVRKSYTLVPMDELVEQAEYGFEKLFSPSQIAGVKLRDHVGRGGTWGCREYLFPAIGQEIVAYGGDQRVGYRCIITNSYNGRSSAGLTTGLIDFFCTNGLVTGDFEVSKTRHTKGFDIALFQKNIEVSVEAIQTHLRELQVAAETRIKADDDDKVLKFFQKSAGKTLGHRLHEHYHEVEVPVRGETLWGVISTLTYYSSHNSEAFPVRSDNDNYRLKRREEEVTKIFAGRTWKDFREAIAA